LIRKLVGAYSDIFPTKYSCILKLYEYVKLYLTAVNIPENSGFLEIKTNPAYCQFSMLKNLKRLETAPLDV
jgi:hypothetical protein